MHKMSNIGTIISMTRSEEWATSVKRPIESAPLEDFCVNRCPHQDEDCTGDCSEMKAFRMKYCKENRKDDESQ